MDQIKLDEFKKEIYRAKDKLRGIFNAVCKKKVLEVNNRFTDSLIAVFGYDTDVRTDKIYWLLKNFKNFFCFRGKTIKVIWVYSCYNKIPKTQIKGVEIKFFKEPPSKNQAEKVDYIILDNQFAHLNVIYNEYYGMNYIISTDEIKFTDNATNIFYLDTYDGMPNEDFVELLIEKYETVCQH